jgi:hypothetical protein
MMYDPSTNILGDVNFNFKGKGSNITQLDGSNMDRGTVAAARVATLNQNTTGSSGSCTGNAGTASQVYVTDNSSYNGNLYPIFAGPASSANKNCNLNSGFYTNPYQNYVYATDFIASSDMRLKDKVGTIDNALTKVCSLDGFLYTWNEESPNGDKETVQVGVSAQQVQGVLPEAVDEDEDGYLGVKYDKLVPLLIEAIKELKADNEELRASFEELKSHK